MKNPFLKTYAIVALAAAFGAYLWFVERKKPANPEDKPKEKVFASVDKAKVRAISIKRAAETISLAKEGDLWRMTEPQLVAADANEVEGLISTIQGLEVGDVATESAAKLSEYGLEPPQQTISLEADGGAKTELLIGDKAPAESGLFAKLPGASRVFTIPAYLATTLDKKPFDLRDRDLLHVKRDDVTALSITGPQGAYALAKGEKGGWRFTAPSRTLAAPWSVDGLLGTLEALRMESVAAEDGRKLDAFGLAKPARTISVTLRAGTVKTLALGNATPDKKYYAKEASGVVVAVIPPALVDDLAKGPGELRAKRLLDVGAYEVEGVDIAAAGAAATFEKTTTKDKDGVESTKWRKKAPEKEIPGGKIEDALSKIGGVEAAEFIDKPGDLAQYGLDKPEFKGVLRLGAGKDATWFEIGRKNGKAYARRKDDDAVLRLDPAKVDELVKAFAEL